MTHIPLRIQCAGGFFMRLNGFLPAEATSGAMRVVLTAQSALLVEQHQGILSFDPSCIRLRTKNGYLTIDGQNLALSSYGAQDADGIYYQAEVHRAAYRACAAAMQAEQKAAAALEDAREHQCETHERLLQSLDFESGTGEAAALYQRKCALESVCTRLRTQQAQLTGAALAIGDPMALGSEHAQLLEQRDALERQYAAIALAIETLGRADAELQSRFSPQLAQKAADYMDYLTDGRYDELVLARDLSAKARSADDPTPRDTAYLSAGTADLLYLSVRLALCELTCPADDPCPLVLDDTLVNFDDARAKRAMALFHEIAQHRQVILFTCHERDCPAQG